MPRTNPLRAVQNEANLARRIEHERQRRDWTYEGTARRLTDAGYAIQASAIYKIEKADPPRRITVDELVGFATIFATSVEDLLLPIEATRDRRTAELLREYLAASEAAGRAWHRQATAVDALLDHFGDSSPDRSRLIELADDTGVETRSAPLWIDKLISAVDRNNYSTTEADDL